MKQSRLSVRVNDDLLNRLKSVADKTGLNQSDIVTQCISSLCDHVEDYGNIIFPVEIFPADTSAHMKYLSAVNDKKADYNSAQRKLKRSVIRDSSKISLNEKK